MKPVRHSGLAGVGAVAALALALPAMAETVLTVNGVDVDSSILDFYIETRTQQPAAVATAEQRQAMLDELADIYLISTQDRAIELADDSQFKAQAELQYRGLLAQVVAADFITQNEATEDEIAAEYETQIALQSSKQYNARHILVETQEDAISVIGELDGGADFAELARERSTGPSGPNGGDLGWFAPEQMVKPFSDAVVAMEDGTYTKEPVQTQFGWHVIYREASRDNEPPTLESLRDALKQRVEQQKLQSYLEGLRSELQE